jgi:hypothetical protein
MKKPTADEFGLTQQDISIFQAEESQTPRIKLILAGLATIPLTMFFSAGVLGGILSLFIGNAAFGLAALVGLFGSFFLIEWKQIFRMRCKYYKEKRPSYISFKKQLGYYTAHIKALETNRLKAEKAEMQKNYEYWFSLDGKRFEEDLKALLLRSKYTSVRLTPTTGDQGIDLWATAPDGRTAIFQCKAHKKKIGPSAVRDLFGTFVALKGKADYAVMVALSGCTSGARTYAQQNGIYVWTINDILKLNKKDR